MAIQTINIGNVVNDGLGDDLRTAFQKVNANFTELNGQLTVTASNVPTGGTGVGVFKQKTGSNLEFKKLIGEGRIIIEEVGNADTVRIRTTQYDGFRSITTESGSVTANAITGTDQITIQGGPNIDVTANGTVVTVDTSRNLENILGSIDFGSIGTVPTDTLSFLAQAVEIDFGTFDSPAAFEYDAGTL